MEEVSHKTNSNKIRGCAHVARSKLEAIRREREGAHETSVGFQYSSFLEPLSIPIVQPILLIL